MDSIEGVVIVPDDFKEIEKKELLLIKLDGTTSYIRSDVEPNKNYFVISRNERAGFNNTLSQAYGLKNQKKISAADGKPMTIVQATFTSIEAKRTVESWALGEPEVRVNVIYPYINQLTNSIEELRNSTFLYPEQWLKTGFWKNTVKWNTARAECSYWFSNEKYYGRRVKWTEEDGTSAPYDHKQSYTDPITKITTEYTIKVPAKNGDVLFADNWLYYDIVGTGGRYTWSIIQFDVSCE